MIRVLLALALAFAAAVDAAAAWPQDHIFTDGFESMADTGWVVPPNSIMEYFEETVVTSAQLGALNDGTYVLLGDVDPYSPQEFSTLPAINPIFGSFGLPGGAQVVGIECRIAMLVRGVHKDGYLDVGDSLMRDYEAYTWDGLDQPNSDNRANFYLMPQGGPPPATFGLAYWGGPNDSWAMQDLTPTYWNGVPQFYFQFRNTGTAKVRVWLDHIACKLHYVIPTGIPAQFTGAGTLGVTPTKQRHIPFAAVGNGSMAVSMFATRTVGQAFSGSGKLLPHLTQSIGGVEYVNILPEFVGRGQFAQTLGRGHDFGRAFVGGVTLSPGLTTRRHVSGISSVGGAPASISLVARRHVSGSMVGTGSFAAVLTPARKVTAAATGTGAFAATVTGQRTVGQSYGGAGTLDVLLTKAVPIVDALAVGTGTLDVVLTKAINLPVGFVGTGTFAGPETDWPDLDANAQLPAETRIVVPGDRNSITVPGNSNSIVVTP